MVNLHDTKGDDWEEMAKIYKQLTVGTSHRPITVMLEKSNALLPFSQATGIHDNGCGPGPVISRIISSYGTQIPSTASLSASDFAPGMIAQVEATKSEEIAKDPSSPWSRVETSVLNAMDLQGIPDSSKSHVTAGWVYFMTPDPMKCLLESKRILQPNGVLAVSSWKDSQWMEIMKKVQDVRSDAPLPKIPELWQSKEGVRGEFEKAGFKDIESVEIDVEMHFDKAESFVELLTGKMPHIVALTKEWSEEERKRLREVFLRSVKEVAPEEPGKMSGVALVAVARK